MIYSGSLFAISLYKCTNKICKQKEHAETHENMIKEEKKKHETQKVTRLNIFVHMWHKDTYEYFIPEMECTIMFLQEISRLRYRISLSSTSRCSILAVTRMKTSECIAG